MFFKMLKSDLKLHKGLNVILFIFMIAAAAFVFVSTAQIYSIITQNNRTREVCRSSSVIARLSTGGSTRDDLHWIIDDAFRKSTLINDFEYKEYIPLEYYSVDFQDYEEDMDDLENYEIFLSTAPKSKDIVVNQDDSEVSVPNGKIAVPITMKSFTGAEAGDKIRLTTAMGRVYELEIGGFIKDPLCEEAMLMRYIVSDADYELLAKDFPIKTDLYSIELNGGSKIDNIEGLYKLLDNAEVFLSLVPTELSDLSETKIILYVLAIFIVVISIFTILIIFMTIRFTIIAALKKEEKEIGVMRALGVDSFGFRWLFIAKYIFFAIAGGVIGIFCGYPLAELLLRTFSENYAYPDPAKMTAMGIIGVIVNVWVIILFAMGIMGHINKISVIDAIHGENREERFGKASVLSLGKRKKMPVSLFLALSDILSRAKRYIFPVIAYTLSMLILLLVFNLRNTIMSKDFMKYMNIHTCDFALNFSLSQTEKIDAQAQKNELDFYEEVNKELSDSNIPAHVDIGKITNACIKNGENRDVYYRCAYNLDEPEKCMLRKGGRIPRFDNEAALSYFTAEKMGIKIGDTVTLEMYIMSEDRTYDHKENRKFIVTGFFDYIEWGVPMAIIGGEHDDFLSLGSVILGFTIFAPESGHSAVIKQMNELFGENSVLEFKDSMAKDMKRYDMLLSFLEFGMGGMLLFITVLITYLYQNIFIVEETSDVAMMKSMGFSDGSVKLWQALRMLILAGVSAALAEILFQTAGAAAARALFTILSLSGFGFIFELPVTFILIPLIFIAAIIAVTFLVSCKADSVAVWDIADE